MEKIPIRSIGQIRKERNLSCSFSIRDIQELLDGKGTFQELHRHDFYYILVLKKGSGNFTGASVAKRSSLKDFEALAPACRILGFNIRIINC